jgi:pyrroline-5-carboxylate reductase
VARFTAVLRGEMEKIAVIGLGTMGGMLVRGLLNAGVVSSSHLFPTTRTERNTLELGERYGLQVGTDNVQAARSADIIILAVKPSKVAGVLKEEGMSGALQGKILVSIAAGVCLRDMAEILPSVKIARAMPNTPGIIGKGMTVVSPAASMSSDDMDRVLAIFSTIGRCRVLGEEHLNAVTGLSGSGPAFACVILEALADGGVMMGLPRDVAIELAAQMFLGTAELVLSSGRHPAELKDEVTTPAGCTIAGLLMLEDGKIRSTLARAIQESSRVASGLGS